MNEQELHDYTKWLMEVWNPNQLYIPFAIDAPRAYLRYKAEEVCPTTKSTCFYCKKDENNGKRFCENKSCLNNDVYIL